MAFHEDQAMIARFWRGTVPARLSGEYRNYLNTTGLPGYLRAPGNLGVYLLGRQVEHLYETAFLTLWTSMDSLRDFAGQDVSKARYYARDLEFLVDPPLTVDHFDVLASHLRNRTDAGESGQAVGDKYAD